MTSKIQCLFLYAYCSFFVTEVYHFPIKVLPLGPVYTKRERQCSVSAAMTPGILVSRKTMERKKVTQECGCNLSGATLLISVRAAWATVHDIMAQWQAKLSIYSNRLDYHRAKNFPGVISKALFCRPTIGYVSACVGHDVMDGCPIKDKCYTDGQKELCLSRVPENITFCTFWIYHNVTLQMTCCQEVWLLHWLRFSRAPLADLSIWKQICHESMQWNAH